MHPAFSVSPAAALRFAWIAIARRLAVVACVAIALLLLTGCGGSKIQPISPDEAFPPAKPADYTMRCFKNTVTRPHRDIAWIDSTPLSDRSEESWEKQLQELQAAARKIGADAVHNVRALKLKARGAVIDEDVPFTAVKQDRYDLYFLRGTATVYLDEGAAAPPAPNPAASAEGESLPPASAPAVFAPIPAPSQPPPGATNVPRSAASEAEGHHSASDEDGDEVGGEPPRKKNSLSGGVSF